MYTHHMCISVCMYLSQRAAREAFWAQWLGIIIIIIIIIMLLFLLNIYVYQYIYIYIYICINISLYICIYIYMACLVPYEEQLPGWLETRLAQNSLLNCISTAQRTLNNKHTHIKLAYYHHYHYYTYYHYYYQYYRYYCY